MWFSGASALFRVTSITGFRKWALFCFFSPFQKQVQSLSYGSTYFGLKWASNGFPGMGVWKITFNDVYLWPFWRWLNYTEMCGLLCFCHLMLTFLTIIISAENRFASLNFRRRNFNEISITWVVCTKFNQFIWENETYPHTSPISIRKFRKFQLAVPFPSGVVYYTSLVSKQSPKSITRFSQSGENAHRKLCPNVITRTEWR